MVTAKKKKKTSDKTELGEKLTEAAHEALEEEVMDLVTANADNPEVVAVGFSEPTKKRKAKKKRITRNALGEAPGSHSSFKSWFTNKLEQDKRLKPHHMETIKIYLKGLGIQEGSGAVQYEKGLKRYFGEG